jgi:hypothetical protein
MEQATVTHYEVLGVPTTADTAEIKKSYQRRLRTSHPDMGGSTGLFRLVQEAYEVLSDPARRAAYDRTPKDRNSGHAGGTSNQGPRQERSRPQPDSSRQKPEPAFADMEQPPIPPAWTGPAVEYRPPLVPPSGEPQKIRRPAPLWTRTWRTVFFVLGSVFSIPLLISTIWYFSTTQSNPNWLAMGLTCLVATGLTAGFWFVAAMLPKWWTTRRRPAPPAVLASAYLIEEIIGRTVHGVPGRGLSVGRFGERAEIGAEGERRTARLITDSVLPAIPAARLINGLRWPGSEHADLDHAVIAGNRIALIDSKMWADGAYWWDNKQLFRNGRELKAFGLGAGVEAIRAAYPGYAVEGWVVLHSPSGSLTLPSVERAGIFPLPGRAPVRLVTPLELVAEIHAFLVQGEAPHAVQVPALAGLLRSML